MFRSCLQRFRNTNSIHNFLPTTRIQRAYQQTQAIDNGEEDEYFKLLLREYSNIASLGLFKATSINEREN